MPAVRKLTEDGEILVEVFSKLDSTNDYLKGKALRSPRSVHIAIAGSQLCGRGQRGKSFASPEGGLYFSLKARTPEAIKDMPFIATPLAGLALQDLLTAQASCDHLKFDLKWINDILVGGRKLAGILTEYDAEENAIIIGIGINWDTCELPSEIEDIATSLSILLGEAYATSKMEVNQFAAMLAGKLIDYIFYPSADNLLRYKRTCIGIDEDEWNKLFPHDLVFDKDAKTP